MYSNKIVYILLLFLTIYNIPVSVCGLSLVTPPANHPVNQNGNPNINVNGNVNVNRNGSGLNGNKKVGRLSSDETCLDCVEFFDDYLPDIINIVTEYGVVESCSKICSLLLNNTAATTCTVLCDVIGVEKFWKIFLLDDINPIYACQLISTCDTSNSPAANFNGVAILPSVGIPGSTFTISLNFSVVNSTGAGQFAYVVYYIVNQSKYLYTQTFANYNPGNYSIQFTFSTKNNGSFPLGSYPVELFMCASECGTHTPYSVALNQSALIEFSLQEPTEQNQQYLVTDSFGEAQTTLTHPYDNEPEFADN